MLKLVKINLPCSNISNQYAFLFLLVYISILFILLFMVINLIALISLVSLLAFFPSHTAAIAAGNNGIPVRMHGHEFGKASGMAPRAR